MSAGHLDFITEEQAAALLYSALGVQPRVTRQTLSHSGNSVFRAELSDEQFAVLRISPQPGTFKYTEKNLIALRQLGLPVQTVLASGSTSTGGSFILLNWIGGRDLMYALPHLRHDQMTHLAQTITDYQKRIGTLPKGKGFGWAPIGQNAALPRWSEIFGPSDGSPVPESASEIEQFMGRLRAVRCRVDPYFASVEPTCFLDDLTIKNVLVENGELTGIIDLDYACYGDPLMSVGTTLGLIAADVGSAGSFYSHELVRSWNPTPEQTGAIHFYAALWVVGMLKAAQADGDSARLNALLPIADTMLQLAEEAWAGISTSPVQLLETATAQHRAGNLAEARRLYQQAVLDSPDQLLPQFRLGLLELQEGHPLEALPLISNAARAYPLDGRFQFGLGEVLTALKRWDQAVAAYQLVPKDHARYADANYAIGVAFQNQSNYVGAIQAYQNTLRIQPDFAAAMSNLGTLLGTTGHPDQAIEVLRQSIALQPDVADHLINLSAVLCQQRQFAKAQSLLQNVLEHDSNNVDATYNLGLALHGLGKSLEAAEQYRRAIFLRSDHVDAHINLGNIYKELGDFKLAAAAYESALELQPQSVTALNNTGCLLRTMGKLQEAEATLRRGLSCDENNAALQDNLGNVLKDAGRLDQAIECFRKALSLDPTNAATHSNLAYALSFQSTQPATILEECLRWNDQHAFPLQSHIRSHPNDRSPNRRLRVGYVSPDFRDHCQSLFTIPLLSHHDHDRFEIICYSSVERPDEYTRRIATFADLWRDVRALDDQSLSDQIRADQIDILVDLTMHMADGRPLVFARKPAPIQITWLAYPGTTGVTAIDYRLSDPRLDPPGFENHYSEKTIHLPDSFWCYDPLTDQPNVNALPALSTGHVTLGCLNNPCKLTDHTLALWAGVMHALPTAKLLLMSPPGSYRQDLLHRFAAHSVDPHRIDFVSYRPRGEYLRTYHQIDLGLDTFPYNGHTTSLDSFWMGVPVITRIGPTCVGRGGLSQLFQLGLTELASDNDQEFVEIVVKLAQDLPRLMGLRHQLRDRLTQSPLMDGKRFALNIEAIYRQAWEHYSSSS